MNFIWIIEVELKKSEKEPALWRSFQAEESVCAKALRLLGI